jgi:phosphatidate cytidylyltransferase
MIASISFAIYHKVSPGSLSINLVQRTNSWWVILLLYILMMGVHPIMSYVGFGLISFIGHRELVSKLNFPNSVRRTVLWSYFFIPIQYYLAYKQSFASYSILIPLGGFIFISFRTILEDRPDESIKLFSQLHWSLMLTTFSISHIPYFISLPTIPGNINSYQELIFFLIFISQTNDIFQYISGKLFGKRKVCPNISPNKTWAGIVGGIIGSLFLGYVFEPLVPLTIIQSLVGAVLISLAGILGDMNISAIKRNLKIKDMSNFIPGHGGVLDRIDSLTFSAPLFFYLIYYWIYK